MSNTTLLVTVSVIALLVGHLIPRGTGRRATGWIVLRLNSGLHRAGLRRPPVDNSDYERRVRLNDAVRNQVVELDDAQQLLLATARLTNRGPAPS